MKTHRWLPLWLNLVLLAIAISLYAPFGLRGNFGLFEEFTARYGYVRVSLVTRPTALWTFQFADWLTADSYIGFNWLMIASFWLKGALMVGIIRRLFPHQISLAVVAGLLMMVYPADSGNMALRSITYHFLMVCAMAATYGVIGYWQKPHWAWWLWIVPLQILALAYEIHYPVFLLVPLIWLARGISRRTVLLTLAWGMTPLILGLRVVWFTQTGSGGYVNSVINVTDNNKDNLTLDIALRTLLTVFERHLIGWTKGLALVAETPFGPLAIALGIVSGLFVWVFYRAPSLKWRLYPIIFVSGFILLLAAYVLFLPTLYRLDSFRVNILTTIGATLMACTPFIALAQVLGNKGRLWLTASAAVLVMGGMAYQLDQAEHYGKLSGNVQQLLGGIAAEAPAVESDSVIVFIDRDLEFQQPFQLGGSSFYFQAAIQFLYNNDDLRGVLCVLRETAEWQSCFFTPDELVRYDDWAREERLPYERLIVLHRSRDGQVRLLTELPPDYVRPYGITTPAAYAPLKRVNQQAGPPARVYTAFPCWPLDGCLETPPSPEPMRSVRLEMDTPPPGVGWLTNAVPSACWTLSTNATLRLPLASTEPMQVQFKVTDVLLPEILDGVALLVNGTDIPLTQTANDDGTYLYTGVIPVDILAHDRYASGEALLVIHTDRVVSAKEIGLNEDVRRLGVLIDWVAIAPVTP